MTIDATVIYGRADWYAEWGLIADDLGRIGIKVTVDCVPDLGAWINDAVATKKATLLWNTAVDTKTPYSYFKEHLDSSSFVPSGENAELTGNWEHFADRAATPLLARFRATDDPADQHQIAGHLEQRFLDNLPFVPLFAAPI